jgi:DNA-binding MarR family transcriptional regulator
MFEKTIKKYLFSELQLFDDSQDEDRNALNYFRRSRIHWLYLLNLMRSYYEKKPITKSDLIHKIQVSHITILKYIKESIQLDLVEEIRSKNDKRKVILIPHNILIQDFENFYYDHTREMKQLFDDRQDSS